MQQGFYNKLHMISFGFIIFCTIIAALVAMFFLAPMILFGGGPFGMGAPPNIPDSVMQELTDEIYALESVNVFKETFPGYRENIEEQYGVEYSLQARNENTGNILALNIHYYPIGPPGSSDSFNKNENLQCIPGKDYLIDQNQRMMFGNNKDLFIHETIKATNCLDDDWQPKVLSEK